MDTKSTSDKCEDEGCKRFPQPATEALAQHVDADDDGEILKRLRNQAVRYVMDPEEFVASKGIQQVQKDTERFGGDLQVQISEVTTENTNQGIEKLNEMGKHNVVMPTDAVGHVLIVGGNTIVYNSNEQDQAFLKQTLRQMDTLGEANQDILEKSNDNGQLQSSSTEHLATLPPVIVPRSRLVTTPGAQHIGNRALSQDYSVTGQQSVYEPEEQMPPPILTAHVVDQEIAMQDSAPVLPMPLSTISVNVEILQDPQPIWKILLTNHKYQGGIAFFVLLVGGLIVGLVFGVGLPSSNDFVQSAAKSPSSSPMPLQSFRPYLSTRLTNASLTALARPDSLQHKALAWIDSDTRNWTDTRRLQRWVLHVLHGFTNGSKWLDNSGWLLESTECTWMNVLCDPLDIEVMSLLLSRNNLEGSMPEELALLTSLQTLDFQNNLLSETIPSVYGELTNLRKLHVGNNTLTGTLPKTVESLLSLEYLSIEFNSISGLLPKGLMELKNLSLFHAEGNHLSGSLPLGEWSSWLDLRLSGNNFTGSISSNIGLLTNLTTIDLGQNFFESTLPSEFGELTELHFLSAYGNVLSGNIPTDLGLLTNLDQLYLHGNYLNGTIPTDLGRLTGLQGLYLDSNKFTGSLPSQFGWLTGVTMLCLHVNYLNGTIPTELGRLTGLQGLYLNTNNFTGSIPSQLGQLTGLTMLSLEGNLLSGSLPSELSSLTDLVGQFSLANTSLTGTVPVSLCQPSVTITIDCCHMTLCICCICAFDMKNCNLYSFRPFLSTVLSNTSLDALDIIGSPQQQALAWIELGERNITDTQRLQRWALYVLHVATNGDKWKNSWKSSFDSNECTWTNVFCLDSKVVSLTLKENGLDGRIPEELALLRELQVLELFDNNLIGNVPSVLGHLTNLKYLLLASNALTGTLPESIGNLIFLDLLTVDTNHFTGSLPNRISELKVLTAIIADRSTFSGPLPVDMGKLTAMVAFLLPLNAFTGSIPSQIGLLTNLQYVYLGINFFESSLPSELGMLTLVEDLDFGDNFLEGEIPSELAQATNLQHLFMQNNHLNSSIPTELGLLTNLLMLDLSENDITGTIPTELGHLTNLQELSLDLNFLNGSIPSQLGQLTGLSVLLLGDNFLTGIIPSELGLLTTLTLFTIDNNVFTGNPILLCQNGTALKINC